MSDQAATPIDAPIDAMQESIASCNTALSCLALLGVHYGIDLEIGAIRSRNLLDTDTLRVSRLIELAGEFGLKAQYVHRDWRWLQLAVTSHPILLLLKNTNVVVAIGSRRGLPEEIVVLDPLHHDGEVVILPRTALERAWEGTALTITPQPRPTEIRYEDGAFELPGQLRHRASMLSEPAVQSVTPALRLGVASSLSLLVISLLFLASVALIATASLRYPRDEKIEPFSVVVPRGRIPATVAHRPPAADALPHVVLSPPVSPPDRVPDVPTEPTPTTEMASPPSVPPPMPPALVPPAEPASTGMVAPPPASPADAAPSAEPVSSGIVIPPVATPKPILSGAPEQAAARSGRNLPTGEIAALLVARGDEYLARGDLFSARLFYEHGAEAGGAIAALRLGETFDPAFLDRIHLRDGAADLDRAVSWYRRAGELGSDEAQILLRKLESK